MWYPFTTSYDGVGERRYVRILAISTLLPNRTMPNFGVFVLERLKSLAQVATVAVVAPVTYFPGAGFLSRYRLRRGIPPADKIDGVAIAYPRFFSIPRYLKPLDPIFLALRLLPQVLRTAKQIDVIECHLAFPDGVAGVILGAVIGKPVSITLRGHEMNVLSEYPVRRRQIMWALGRARWVFAVAEALRQKALELGVASQKIEVIPNGVNHERFCPMDREDARLQLARLHGGERLSGNVLLSVGHLVERKGHHILVDALKLLHEHYGIRATLVIVGAASEEGDYSKELQATMQRSGRSSDVVLAGDIPQSVLGLFYNAADVTCLASSKEGRPNVLIESLACGTPVVATDVWGIPEIVTDTRVGTLVGRTAEEFAQALADALFHGYDRDFISEFSNLFSWQQSVDRILARYSEHGAKGHGGA
ncbi:glycosyltransferase [Aminobacter anthyllidis]|uniref:Glycosyltransferase n=1 Tax=Aminobacter anthyllidis TaxID=1035067 RepID=A0A9X1AGQ3_9HYPH|nr:glycosyltransferase [Aminobacter anthyllidis]MBT1159328.1 glycosyltransferase [Aminobacter anthyllidis]